MFGEKSRFQVIREMKLFYGGKFSDGVSSEKLLAVSATGPPAVVFFQKLTFLYFWDMPILEKCAFPGIW